MYYDTITLEKYKVTTMKSARFVIISKFRENNSDICNSLKDALISNGFLYDEKTPEIIFVVGGDGSLMRAFHQYEMKGKYVLLNTGHLGFFSDYDANEIQQFIQDVLTKEPTEEHFHLYEVQSKGISSYFVNDIAIQSAQTIFIDLYVDHELLTSIRSNGIVVSSPVGSTGYLTSLGSPLTIGHPDVYQYCVIAPCYNRLSLNPISKAILSNHQELKIVVRSGKPDVYLDGRFRHEWKKIPNHTSFTIRGDKDIYTTLLHFRTISPIKRLRKNISGKED